jgi:hypothetical protein
MAGTVLTVGTILGVLAPAAGSTAAGAAERVSRGEATAVLEAYGTGGRAIINHSPRNWGAPSDIELRATIRPLAEEGFDGRHYCAEDWHTIVLAIFDFGDRTFSRQDFADEVSHVVITMSLDGTVLPTMRTAIKEVSNPQQFGAEKAYAFQQGTVLSPSDLSVGAHSLDTTTVFPPDTFQDHITFYIDAPGTGACL